MKHTKNETIDTFFTRCLQARKEVVSNGIACTEDDLHQIFIMGLSAHPTIIQEKLDDLPDEWLDPNIHSISATAQKFFDNKMEVRNHQRTLRQTESQQPSRNNNQQQQNQNQRQQQQQRASNNNNSDNSQWDKANWDHAIDEQRKHSIYNEIMGDIFDVGRYLHTVPQRSCLYHGIPHAGCTEQCIALQNIYTKAQMAGVSNTPIVHHLKTTRPLMLHRHIAPKRMPIHELQHHRRLSADPIQPDHLHRHNILSIMQRWRIPSRKPALKIFMTQWRPRPTRQQTLVTVIILTPLFSLYLLLCKFSYYMH